MRASGAIIAGLVAIIIAIIIAIIVQFYSPSAPKTALVLDRNVVPEPSQMMSPEYTASLIDLLKRSDPDVWHQVAMGWNWDGGLAPLAWIVRQPRCDRGTALLIYWHGGPGWYKQYAGRSEVPAFAVEGFDLLQEVEGRFLSGFYVRQEVAFDPHNDGSFDWTAEYADVPTKRDIPESLFESTRGRQILKPCVFLPSGLKC